MTVLAIDGVWNARDVGGMTASEGRIRSGVLLRSASLAYASEVGLEALRGHAKHIIDLRSDDEVRDFPSRVNDITITHLPLFHGSTTSFFQADATLAQLYAHIIEEGAEKVVDAMRIIAAGEPTLVHCMVGKDRTGVTIALALAAVDADRDAVITDYALTESQLPVAFTSGVVGHLRQLHPEALNLVDLATKSPAEVMRRLLAGIDEEYGSAAAYLRAHGLTTGELSDLRAVLVEG